MSINSNLYNPNFTKMILSISILNNQNKISFTKGSDANKKHEELMNNLNKKFADKKLSFSLYNDYIKISSSVDDMINSEFKDDLISLGIDHNDIILVNDNFYKPNKIFINYQNNIEIFNDLLLKQGSKEQENLNDSLNKYVNNINQLFANNFGIEDSNNRPNCSLEVKTNIFENDEYIIKLDNLSNKNIDMVEDLFKETEALSFADFNFETVDINDFSMYLNFSTLENSVEEILAIMENLNINLENFIANNLEQLKSTKKKKEIIHEVEKTGFHAKQVINQKEQNNQKDKQR